MYCVRMYINNTTKKNTYFWHFLGVLAHFAPYFGIFTPLHYQTRLKRLFLRFLRAFNILIYKVQYFDNMRNLQSPHTRVTKFLTIPNFLRTFFRVHIKILAYWIFMQKVPMGGGIPACLTRRDPLLLQKIFLFFFYNQLFFVFSYSHHLCYHIFLYSLIFSYRVSISYSYTLQRLLLLL